MNLWLGFWRANKASLPFHPKGRATRLEKDKAVREGVSMSASACMASAVHSCLTGFKWTQVMTLFMPCCNDTSLHFSCQFSVDNLPLSTTKSHCMALALRPDYMSCALWQARAVEQPPGWSHTGMLASGSLPPCWHQHKHCSLMWQVHRDCESTWQISSSHQSQRQEIYLGKQCHRDRSCSSSWCSKCSSSKLWSLIMYQNVTYNTLALWCW